MVEWFVALIANSALASQARALEVKLAMQKTKELMRKLGGNLYSHELINALFSRPTMTADSLLESGAVNSLTTAHARLKLLADNGVLYRSSKRRGRKVAYVNFRLLQALKNQYAAHEASTG